MDTRQIAQLSSTLLDSHSQEQQLLQIVLGAIIARGDAFQCVPMMREAGNVDTSARIAEATIQVWGHWERELAPQIIGLRTFLLGDIGRGDMTALCGGAVGLFRGYNRMLDCGAYTDTAFLREMPGLITQLVLRGTVDGGLPSDFAGSISTPIKTFVSPRDKTRRMRQLGHSLGVVRDVKGAFEAHKYVGPFGELIIDQLVAAIFLSLSVQGRVMTIGDPGNRFLGQSTQS